MAPSRAAVAKPSLQDPALAVRTLVDGLNTPTAFAFAGSQALFVLEKNTAYWDQSRMPNVDKIIFKRLRLESYTVWRKNRIKLLALEATNVIEDALDNAQRAHVKRDFKAPEKFKSNTIPGLVEAMKTGRPPTSPIMPGLSEKKARD